MYLRLLQIRDIDDVAHYLEPVARLERLRGQWDVANRDGRFGSHMDTAIVARATAAALRLSGLEASSDQVAHMIDQRPTAAEPGVSAAAHGYADVVRLVMDHSSEVPFAENQIKYFHSLLLRHDPTAEHRRTYRPGGGSFERCEAWRLAPAPPAEAVAAEMPRLVAWTKGELDAATFPAPIPIAVFLFRFLALRPFADANARLALTLATYLLDLSGYNHLRISPLEEVVEDRRQAFADALGNGRAGAGEGEDASGWVQVFVDALAESQRRALEAVGAARPAPRLNARQIRLLEILGDRKAAKIGDLLDAVASPRATIKKDLRGLVEAGYLVTSGQRKGTVYHVVL